MTMGQEEDERDDEQEDERWIFQTREIHNWVALIGVLLAVFAIIPESWHVWRGLVIVAWIWILAWVAAS